MFDYQLSLLTVMGINAIMALSLNIIAGYCGQISLGHAAFVGAGAYTAALLAKLQVPFLVSLFPAAVVAGVLGVVIGIASLRVRHDFLAITTLGVGLLFVGIIRQQPALGGAYGISGIPSHELGKGGFALFVVGIAVVVAVFSIWLKRSWMGTAFDSIADDEDTARIVGIDVPVYKLIAFAMGTTIAGVAGCLYAYQVRFIGPDSFGFVESITILSMVVIGGIGSVWGVVIAAAVLSVLPLWFQFVQDYKLLLYGTLLFVVMRFVPGGIAAMLGAAGRLIGLARAVPASQGARE